MSKRKLDSTILKWWNRLSQVEQDVLIEVLYDLDLNDNYVEMDNDGKILRKKTS